MKWLCFFSVTQKQRLHYTDHIRKLPVSQCANYIFETTKKKRCAQLPSAPFAPSSHPVQPTFVTWWKVECAAGLGKLANVSACICATGMETVYGLCQCMVICTSLWNCMWSHMKEPFKWSFYFCLPLWPWTSLRVFCLAERKKGEKKTSGQRLWRCLLWTWPVIWLQRFDTTVAFLFHHLHSYFLGCMVSVLPQSPYELLQWYLLGGYA